MDFDSSHSHCNCRRTVGSAILVFAALLSGFDRYAECAEYTLERIAPGTLVTPKKVEGWSHMLLVSTPKLTSGDIELMPGIVLQYASMFTTVIAVDVEKSGQGYRLRRVGFGLAVRVGDDWRVVSSDDTTSPGSEALGPVARKILAAGEQSLDKLKLVFRASTAVIIDSPAIIAVDDSHLEMPVRHMIWIQPKTGNVSSALWAIESTNPPKVLGDEARLLPPWLVQTRRLRVDHDYFFLGIPSNKAFALESLPHGVTVSFSGEVAAAACAAKPSVEDLAKIAERLMTIAPSVKTRPAATVAKDEPTKDTQALE